MHYQLARQDGGQAQQANGVAQPPQGLQPQPGYPANGAAQANGGGAQPGGPGGMAPLPPRLTAALMAVHSGRSGSGVRALCGLEEPGALQVGCHGFVRATVQEYSQARRL